MFPSSKCGTTHEPRWLRSTAERLWEFFKALQNERQVVHTGECVAVLRAQLSLPSLQDSAPQRLFLGKGATGRQHRGEPQPLGSWEREHFLTRLRGIFLGPNSGKPILSNSRFRNVSISLELSFVLWATVWFTVRYCNQPLNRGVQGRSSPEEHDSTHDSVHDSVHFWIQISGDKTELRSTPAQCLKRELVLRAQPFGCGICTTPQPWSMISITRQLEAAQCHAAAPTAVMKNVGYCGTNMDKQYLSFMLSVWYPLVSSWLHDDWLLCRLLPTPRYREKHNGTQGRTQEHSHPLKTTKERCSGSTTDTHQGRTHHMLWDLNRARFKSTKGASSSRRTIRTVLSRFFPAKIWKMWGKCRNTDDK